MTLACEVLYGSYQVFVVLQPDGTFGPMFTRAADLPIDQMTMRRMYALEAWIAFGVLSIYLGLTEIVPRRRGPSDP